MAWNPIGQKADLPPAQFPPPGGLCPRALPFSMHTQHSNEMGIPIGAPRACRIKPAERPKIRGAHLQRFLRHPRSWVRNLPGRQAPDFLVSRKVLCLIIPGSLIQCSKTRAHGNVNVPATRKKNILQRISGRFPLIFRGRPVTEEAYAHLR